MMNYKLEIVKLEKIVISKKYDVKNILNDIAKIEDKISDYKKLHKENINSSIIANNLLNGFDRQTLSEIVLFIVNTFTSYGSGRPKTILNKIDFSKAVKNEEFFNQVIIALGSSTIREIFKTIKGVIVDNDGFTCLEIKDTRINQKNLGNRLFSKLTKKTLADYIISHNLIKD